MKNLLCFLIAVLIFSCQPGAKKDSKTEQPAGKAELTEVKLQIGGMHCDMCVASIEKGVGELAGISFVKATLADSVTVVRFDNQKVDVVTIEKAIEKRGYTIKGKL